MVDERQAIGDIETEIEQLRDAAERSRKIAIAAKLAMVTGAAAIAVSFLHSSPLALVIGIAASLGSVALLGSNHRTLGEPCRGLFRLEGAGHRRTE